MAASKGKTNVSRRTGQPTPSSSRVATRSHTPASKASQRNTPVPTNITGNTNGHSNFTTNGYTTSISIPEATNGVKIPQTSIPSALTKAHLAKVPNGQHQPGTESYNDLPSSPLSSPPASMVGDLEQYFAAFRAESSSAKEVTPVPTTNEIDGEATVNPESKPVIFEKVIKAPNEHHTPIQSSLKEESHQTSPLRRVSQVSQTSPDRQVSPGVLTSSVRNCRASPALDTKLSKSEAPFEAPNDDTSQSRFRKRSLSSADELAIPNPPVKAEIPRVVTRPRRRARADSTTTNSKDDLSLQIIDAASSVGGDSKAETEPVRRSKRAKTVCQPEIEIDPEDIELPYAEATPAQIAEWDGWLEMESSPETFTVLLQEWGVRGMKAMDVYSLEPEALVMLPQPVHGLIFLYPYREGDWGEHKDPCPDHVWFANQVDGTNACATVALMNIVSNVPDANLGPSLQKFKFDTTPMTAAERGNKLNDFHHIKAVHNSFIHTTGMMEDDVTAEKDYEAREKQATVEAKRKAIAKLAVKKKKAAEKAARKQNRAAAKAAAKVEAEGKSSSRSSPAGKPGAAVTKFGAAKKTAGRDNKANSKKKAITSAKPKKETQAMAKAATKRKVDVLARARYHYVAYLPIKGQLWKLDGMDDEPLNLGPCETATWLDSIAPLIQASMADLNQDGINFSLLAVVQDPIYNDTVDLAANIKTMRQVHEELAKVDPDWPVHPDATDCLGDESLDGPSEDYKVTEEMIGSAKIYSSDREEMQNPKGIGSLLRMKKKLTSQQKMLKSSIRFGKSEDDKRQAQVDQRRRDFNPLIQWQLMDLIDNGVLDELLDIHDPKKKTAGADKGNAKAGKGKDKAKGKKK